MSKLIIDCIIGIDPGKSGGITIWRPNHNTETIKMPDDILDLKQWFEHMKSISSPIIFIEKVQLRSDDITDNPGKVFRVQKMLSEFEKLKTIISLQEIPFVLVHPQKWQNELKLRIKGSREEKKDRKKRYKDIAGNLYKDITPTLWNADATLIMHFGRYILRNNPSWVLQNLPTQIHNKLF